MENLLHNREELFVSGLFMLNLSPVTDKNGTKRGNYKNDKLEWPQHDHKMGERKNEIKINLEEKGSRLMPPNWAEP